MRDECIDSGRLEQVLIQIKPARHLGHGARIEGHRHCHVHLDTGMQAFTSGLYLTCLIMNTERISGWCRTHVVDAAQEACVENVLVRLEAQ